MTMTVTARRSFVLVFTLTDGETKDVFRRRQGEAELPRVMADDLNMQHKQKSWSERKQPWKACQNQRRATEERELICCVCKQKDKCAQRISAVFYEVIFKLVTSLSNSRSAYLMFGSSKVMAGLLLEKKSLKIRLMMLSKPPRISCDERARVTQTAS